MKRHLVPTATCIAFLAVGSIAQAAADTVVYPFDYEYPTCDGAEILHCVGEARDTAILNTNPQGRLLIHYTTTVIGSCVGLTSGTKYLPRGSTTSTRTYAADRTPYQVTIENQFVFISQGNRPNERFSYRGHATVTSNGDLAVNYDRIKLVCE